MKIGWHDDKMYLVTQAGAHEVLKERREEVRSAVAAGKSFIPAGVFGPVTTDPAFIASLRIED